MHLEIFEFQFTHPGGVRHYNITRDTWDAQSFNSRTREGCDGFAGRGSACCVVSIHAPGRGATQIRTHCGGAHAFQFTHPGGVRLGYLPFKVFVSSFNSRTREGCDCIAFAVHLVSKVSIHAPGRGATCTRLLPLRRHACFNSRTREGCDPLHLAYEDPDLTFQFTHPGGVRREEGEGELRLF